MCPCLLSYTSLVRVWGGWFVGFIIVRFISIVLVYGVSHEEQVTTRWHVRVPRSCHGEAKEHEGPHKGSTIGPILLETDNYMRALELIFGVLQKSNKRFLRSVRQYAIGDLNIKFSVHQESFPCDLDRFRQAHLETQVRRHLRSHQIIYVKCPGVDRGLFRNPHTAASCHLWHVNGMGNIRNTTEARGRDVLFVSEATTVWSQIC